MIRTMALAASAVLLASCTWVSLTKEGEGVTVKTADQVTECKKVANTVASLRSKVMGVERNSEKVQAELETLARNAAVDYGGNVVVATSEVEEGKQTFDVYLCP